MYSIGPIRGAILRAIAVVLSVILVPSAYAQVTVAPLVDAKDATEVVATSKVIAFEYEVKNNTASEAHFTIMPSGVARRSPPPCNMAGNDGCTLGWSMPGKNLAPDVAVPQSLGPGKSLVLRFSGEAPALGAYETSVAILDAATDATVKAAAVFRLRISRKRDDLGKDPVAAVNGQRFLSTQGGDIPVEIRNNGTRVVTLTKAPLADLSWDEDDGNYAGSAGRAAVACLPPSDPGASKPFPAEVVLAPGEAYDCELAIPTLPAGKYRARLRSEQTSLVEKLGQVDFLARLPWWVAAAILLVFSGAGALIGHWQNVGRQRTLQTASAMELHVNFSVLMTKAAAVPSAKKIGETVVCAPQKLILEIDHKPPAEVETALQLREKQLPLLGEFARLEEKYRADGHNVGDEVFTKAEDAVSAASDGASAALMALARKAQTPGPAARGIRNLRQALDAVNEQLGFTLNGARALRRRASLIDGSLLAVSVVLACLIGVFGLWYPNPQWGSGPDFVVAALTGLGATVGSALSLNSLVSSYTLARVGRAG